MFVCDELYGQGCTIPSDAGEMFGMTSVACPAYVFVRFCPIPSPTPADTYGRSVAVASTTPLLFRSGWKAMNVSGLPVFELRFAAKSSPAVGSTGACVVAYVPIV